jgi:hypothetical protein
MYVSSGFQNQDLAETRFLKFFVDTIYLNTYFALTGAPNDQLSMSSSAKKYILYIYLYIVEKSPREA